MNTFIVVGSSGSLGLLISGKAVTLSKSESEKLEKLFMHLLAYAEEAQVLVKMNRDITEAKLFPSTRGAFFDWCSERIVGFVKLSKDAEMREAASGF